MKRKIFIASLLCAAMLVSAATALAAAQVVLPATVDGLPMSKPNLDTQYSLTLVNDHYELTTDWDKSGHVRIHSSEPGNYQDLYFDYNKENDVFVSRGLPKFNLEESNLQFTKTVWDVEYPNEGWADNYTTYLHQVDTLSGEVIWENVARATSDKQGYEISWWGDSINQSIEYNIGNEEIGFLTAYYDRDDGHIEYCRRGVFSSDYPNFWISYRPDGSIKDAYFIDDDDSYDWDEKTSQWIRDSDDSVATDILPFDPIKYSAPFVVDFPIVEPITKPSNPVYASFADTGIDTTAIMDGVQAPTVTFKDGAVMVPDNGYTYVDFYTEEGFVGASLIDGMWVCNDSSITADNYEVYLYTLKRTAGFTKDGVLYVSSLLEDDTDVTITKDGYELWQDGVSIRYDENGALTSYSYDPTENSSVTFAADGTMEHFFIYQNDLSYNWDAERGWFLVEIDAEDNWVETPCDAPEGVDLSIYEPAEIIFPVIEPEKPKYTWYPNNTVGLVGLSLRDSYPDLTDKWYNVVPVDLTQNGVQTFRLVASNLFYIGQAAVIVDGDNVTVQYALADGHGYVKDECVRWFTSVDAITTDFLNAPESDLAFGQTISRSKDLNGQDVALLFICNHVTYRQPYTNSGVNLTRYWPNLDEWKAYREDLNALMERLPE